MTKGKGLNPSRENAALCVTEFMNASISCSRDHGVYISIKFSVSRSQTKNLIFSRGQSLFLRSAFDLANSEGKCFWP